MARHRLIVVTLALACGGLLGACAKSATPTTAPTPTAIQAPVTMTRTGGFVGVSQSIEVAPDGSWTYTDMRTNTTEHGTLTAAQVTQLRQLVGDPSFVEQLTKPSGKDVCADGFHYTISMGGDTSAFEDCGGNDRPAVAAAIAALTDATPF